MNVLTLTSLYPNAQQPRHGLFIENRMVQFKQQYPQVNLQVVAPVPWFPSVFGDVGGYGKYAQVADKEVRKGIEVHHPRYLTLPKVGMAIAPALMALSLLRYLKQLRRTYPFDVIDVHYFYPDGVAVAWLAKKLGVPFTVTARGSDIHLLPQYALPKKQIVWAMQQATQSIAVCQALADEMVSLAEQKVGVEVCRNGVNLDFFTPLESAEREALRAELGIAGNTLLSVGNLIELKGHHLIIDAMQDLPDVQLLIAGDGPMRSKLEAQIQAAGVQDRVTLVGLLDQESLKRHYQACDALILASSREGWANVLLEAMACGTPVIATSVWGTPEVVASDEAGLLMAERSSHCIAESVAALLAQPKDREAVREYAEGFAWDVTSEALHRIFTRCVEVAQDTVEVKV